MSQSFNKKTRADLSPLNGPCRLVPPCAPIRKSPLEKLLLLKNILLYTQGPTESV